MADETPTVEKVVETKETTKASTDAAAAAVISPAPAVPADDKIRKEIARYVILSDLIICVMVLVLAFMFAAKLPEGVLAVVATIIGSIIGNRAQNTATVVNYEFGSSSGSTAKTALLDKK